MEKALNALLGNRKVASTTVTKDVPADMQWGDFEKLSKDEQDKYQYSKDSDGNYKVTKEEQWIQQDGLDPNGQSQLPPSSQKELLPSEEAKLNPANTKKITIDPENPINPYAEPVPGSSLGAYLAAAGVGGIGYAGGKKLYQGAKSGIDYGVRRVTKPLTRLEGFNDYASKAAVPVGQPGGFRDYDEQLKELNKLRAKAVANPKLFRPEDLRLLDDKASMLTELATGAGKGMGAMLKKNFNTPGKILGGLLAARLAMEAPSVVSNIFGSGKGERRGGAPVIINS